ncbi:unnamed protein product [Linum tenue]|uniref:Uncharacterized protein n=1 Tax=Linum tenue TaxID=586396 RepID=A0AAV0LWW0_9ROSI|nr:unnamed protein product [Linum tenue]
MFHTPRPEVVAPTSMAEKLELGWVPTNESSL